MRMSNDTQTVVKILTGIIGSVALLITGVAVNSYVDKEVKETESLDKILRFMTLYEYRMTKAESQIEKLELNDREFERSFSNSMEKLSNARSQIQEADFSKKNSSNEQVADR